MLALPEPSRERRAVRARQRLITRGLITAAPRVCTWTDARHLIISAAATHLEVSCLSTGLRVLQGSYLITILGSIRNTTSFGIFCYKGLAFIKQALIYKMCVCVCIYNIGPTMDICFIGNHVGLHM